jgi:DNA-binding CsgD family transcriptional regulator
MGEPVSALLPSPHSPVPGRVTGTWLARSLPRGDVAQLTERERHVLAELCIQGQGVATARQVATALSVAEATVRQHLLHLYRKLGVPPGPERRARLAGLAGQFGLAGPLALTPGTPAHSVPAGDRPFPAALDQVPTRNGGCVW